MRDCSKVYFLLWQIGSRGARRCFKKSDLKTQKEFKHLIAIEVVMGFKQSLFFKDSEVDFLRKQVAEAVIVQLIEAFDRILYLAGLDFRMGIARENESLK